MTARMGASLMPADEARAARRAMEPVLALAVTVLSQGMVLTGGSLQDALAPAAVMVATMLVTRLWVVGASLMRLETGGMMLLGAHALVFPLVFMILGFTRLPISDDHVRQALAAHVVLIGAAWAVMAIADAAGEPTRPGAMLAGAVATWAKARPVAGSMTVAIGALLAAGIFLGYAISTGYFFSFAGVDRRTVYLATGEERLWYVRYGIQGVLLWALAAGFGRPAHPVIRRLAMGAVACFVLATIGMGGRRDVVGVLVPLGVLLYASASSRRSRGAVGIAGLVVLVGLFAFAVLRTGSSDRTLTDLLTVYDLLGEFLFPWQVAGYLVANPPVLLFGASYLYPLVLWIPRRAWPDKPVILAEQFGQQAGVADQLGFGFSPVAESIWNFGVSVGPWIGGVLVALALRGGSALASAHPLLYLAAMGRLLSVPRSELASVFGEMLVLAAVFAACDLLARLAEWLWHGLAVEARTGDPQAGASGGGVSDPNRSP